MLERKNVLIFVGVVLFLGLAYWASTYFMAYTDNAYVRTYVVDLAPRVGGAVDKVHVANNQFVENGTLLITLDQKPFIYGVNKATATLAASAGSDTEAAKRVEAAGAAYLKTESALAFARDTEARYRALLDQKIVPQQKYDRKNEDLKEAVQAHEQSKAELERARKDVGVKGTDIAMAQADLDMAMYRLEHSKIYATVDGWVNNFYVMPGEYLVEGIPFMGLVGKEGWRIEANYREYLVRHIHPGQKVLVYLDGHPWRIFKGTVHGIGRGISRHEVPGKILPYVEPTTNWIRLARRFPVEIFLDNPPNDLRLLHGADARTLVIY